MIVKGLASNISSTNEILNTVRHASSISFASWLAITTMSAGPSPLPISTIQPTFMSVIKDVTDGVVPWEDIWVSCYPSQSPSNSQRDGGGVHGKLRLVLDEVDRNLVIFQHRGDGDAKLERVGTFPYNSHS